MNKLVWTGLGSVVLLASAHAASFDCRKAQTHVEKLICGTPSLSKLDEDLDSAYRQALERDDTRTQTIASQKQWLKDERNACPTGECLEAAYSRRIRELGLTRSFGIVFLQPGTRTTTPGKLAGSNPTSSPTKPQTASQSPPKHVNQVTACQVVAEAANERKLTNLAQEIPIGSDWTNGKLLDINNDGRPERVVGRSSGGNYYFGEFDAFDDKGTPLKFTRSERDNWESDNLRWARSMDLIRYGGQTYILGSTGDYLHYLSRIDRDNVESVICEFGQRSPPIDTLVKSTNDRLCRAAVSRSLEYVDFEHEHGLTALGIQQAGLRETLTGDAAAKVDIDNDGELDLIVSLSLQSSRGMGCDGEHLGILNKTRDQLDMEKTGRLPGPRCGAVEQKAFVFERQTYIEIMYPDGRPINAHEIVQLKGGELERICQFDVRLVHYVLGEYERILQGAKAEHVDPWVYALEMPGTSGLQALLEAGHDVRISVRHNTFPTVLHEAIRRKKLDALTFLLERGAKTDTTTEKDSPVDMPVLIFAIWQNSIEGLQLLLRHGADPDQTWHQQSAKDWAQFWAHSESNKAQMLRLLARR